jgi:hypothetical protein
MRRFLLAILFLGALAGALALAGVPEAHSLLSQLTVGEPAREGNLTIFPVLAPSRSEISGAEFLTLDEGLSQGLVKVGELGALSGVGGMMRPVEPSQRVWDERLPVPQRPQPLPAPRPEPYQGQAQVNELAILNQSDRPLILLAGEIVTGGKQDRVVARDRIVLPHSKPLPLGVFCVEPGRWQGLSAGFTAAQTMAHPLLRQQVTEAQNQQKVWNEVAASRQSLVEAMPAAEASAGGVVGSAVGGVIGSTTSYARTVMAAPVQKGLSERGQALARKIPDDAVGVVVALDGRAVWADIFASPALFARYRDKLLQSYVVEALRRGGAAKSVTRAEAADFLRPLIGHQTTESQPDLYRLVRTEASGTVTY